MPLTQTERAIVAGCIAFAVQAMGLVFFLGQFYGEIRQQQAEQDRRIGVIERMEIEEHGAFPGHPEK